jgi:hypothetical protein
MKKTAAATKQKATKIPVTAAPAQEAVAVATQPKKATAAARKAKAAKPAAKRASTKKASTKKAAPLKAAGTTKKNAVLALISRKNGASLEEIMSAMNWQRHTVRGFISILGKAGTKIASSKSEAGARTYKAA